MGSESPILPDENVRSAIVNCICPECGGAIEADANQFRCLGRCGKDWRAIWHSTQGNGSQTQHDDNHGRVRGRRR